MKNGVVITATANTAAAIIAWKASHIGQRSLFQVCQLIMVVTLFSATACEKKAAEIRPPQIDLTEPAKQESLFDSAKLRAGAESTSKNKSVDLNSSTFDDVAESIGLNFVYLNGERGESLMTETLGTGCGILDYDCDGRWDLYFSQGGDSSTSDLSGQPNDALFRHLPDNRVIEVAEKAGIFEYYYGQATTVGDFDNDGFDDVYISNAGRNTLLRNQGDGTFIDVTQSSGTGDVRWSSSAAFADLNMDGNLDLYVCNYLQYDPLNPKICRNADGEKRVCHPNNLEPWPDQCYINQGDGTFTAEASTRGLVGPGSKGLGVAIADFDGDFLPDIYVANDTTANFLFINQGDGHFTEKAALMGCAMNAKGVYQASMGLAVGDYDNNGYLDIYSTHFEEDSNTLYQNLGPGGFVDVTGITGLHEPTLKTLAFGAIMEDFNQDGYQELLVANGHVENYPGNPTRNMPPHLFAFNGKNWQEYTSSAGAWFQGARVARGISVVDWDGDGDIDPIVVHQNTPTALLENDSDRGHWLNLSFIGRSSNRRGIGVHVTVTSGEKNWIRQLCGGTSYASSHQPTLFFGLGSQSEKCSVKVRWPSGLETQLENVSPDQHLIIQESTGAEALAYAK